MKPNAIAKKDRASLAKSDGQQSANSADAPKYEVIEPGPNPPTYQQVAKAMLDKITTNSPQIINALIKLAADGHYQAAQYLLNQMKELSEELKHTDEQSVVELFRPVIERLNAKYRKPTVIDTDSHAHSDATTTADTNDASACNRNIAPDAAVDCAQDSASDAYTNAVTYFGAHALPSADAPILPAASPPVAEPDAGCYCGSEYGSRRGSSASASNT